MRQHVMQNECWAAWWTHSILRHAQEILIDVMFAGEHAITVPQIQPPGLTSPRPVRYS